MLLTDVWLRPGSLPSLISGRNTRYHPDLESARVCDFNRSYLAFEIRQRFHKRSGWEKVMARNAWFQDRVIRCLRAKEDRSKPEAAGLNLFAYSYAARDIFVYAKKRGWFTILGQIDPGIVEEEIVATERAKEREYLAEWTPAPPAYWEQWNKERELADLIVVNSEWSYQALEKAGTPKEKLQLIPLAYESTGSYPPKQYPSRFTRERPLRVLFLGQINLRKGVARLLRVASRMKDDPIEFWMVGPVQLHDAKARGGGRLSWYGRASPEEAGSFYDAADVFILPTLSDGFALTQLEAIAHRLPVIASQNCGRVARHEENGLILKSSDEIEIEAALRRCLNNPGELAAFSRNTVVSAEFSLASVGRQLVHAVKR
jgi:glycosyltransferase involved in cell wall biosynthesis